MANYKVGDFVTFYKADFNEIEALEKDWTNPEEHHYDYWFDNQISNITDERLYIFEDFDGEWSEEIIAGYSPAYVTGPDGVHDIRKDKNE